MVPEIWSMTDKIFCHFGLFYALLQPRKSKLWKNEKKIPGYIIILHMCIINDNHIIYGSWDDKCDWQFLSFYPTNNPNNQNFERMKKSLEIS